MYQNVCLAGALLLGAAASIAGAQVAAPAAAPAACDCVADFDRLAEKIEANYAAVPLELTGQRRAEYDALRARLRTKSASASDDECVLVLRELTDWFDDDHLFVSEQPRVSPEDAARFAAATERVALDERALRDYLARERHTLDPIEGVWYHRAGYRVAIVAQRALGTAGGALRREFVAVMLTDTIPNWRAGQVKAEFTRRQDGRYVARYRAGDHSPRHFVAALQRDLLLHMPPITWGRELATGAYDVAMLAAHDPRAPMLSVRDDGNVVIALPSHDPQYMARLDSLVQQHREAIERAGVLVVDIRGNEGGSTGTTRALGPFVFTEERRPSLGHEGTPSVLSSEDNIRYFERASSQGWVPAGLVGRMRANPGAIVPFSDDTTAAPPTYRPATVPQGPRHVAILMDRHALSAAEAMVMQAARYMKVTTFGEPTRGTIDYQSVLLVPLACETRGLMLGYPTMAASNRLPAGGLNRTGIAPDVRIGAEETDPVGFIVRWYAGRPSDGNRDSEL